MATSRSRNVPPGRTGSSGETARQRRASDTRMRSYRDERVRSSRSTDRRKTMSRSVWIKEHQRRQRERERRARQRRNLLLLVVIIASVTAAVIVIRGCSYSGVTQSGSAPQNSAEVQPTAAQPYAAAPVGQLNAAYYGNAGETVFVGNALAGGLSRYGLLPGADFCASGAATVENSDTVASNNDSAAIIDKLKAPYSKVFLCYGENELAWNDVRRFEKSYSELLDKVREYKPAASIYLVGIPPVTKTVSDSSAMGINMGNISEYNEAIRDLANEKNLFYADSVGALSDTEGYLPEGISADGINLDRDSYIRLLNHIAQNTRIPSEDDDGATAAPNTAQKASDTPAPTPAPTVNVLKDTKKKTGGAGNG